MIFDATTWVARMPNYTIQQGDCVTSIADQHGLLWTTVWNHPRTPPFAN